MELLTQKIVTKLSKIWIWDPGSGIRDPGSGKNLFRIQGSKRHRIPDPNPQHWYLLKGTVARFFELSCVSFLILPGLEEDKEVKKTRR
jgi:hypothetical protein